MKRILFLITVTLLMANAANAQPAKTRAAATQKTEQAGKSTATDRASLMFPTTAVMPEDVVWKRDIYRQLDLTKARLEGNSLPGFTASSLLPKSIAVVGRTSAEVCSALAYAAFRRSRTP